jgi:hypothetical protein
MADKRIPELPPKQSQSKFGPIAIYDPFIDNTVQIKVQEALGAVRADIDWQADSNYLQNDYVLYLGYTAWKSRINSNQGNVPAENSNWTQITLSPADGITLTAWAAGLFTYDNSVIVYNNQIWFLQTTAPFESSDIDAEIIAGDWATVVDTSSTLFIPTGGNFTAIDIGTSQLIIEFEDLGGVYALPIISSLVNTGYIVQLKNVSGGSITLNSADGIEGDNSTTLIDGENITIYVSSSEYKVL